MTFLYNILTYFSIPCLILRLFWRSFRYKAYRQRLPERFGFVPTALNCIWFHACSVGETLAAVHLVNQCLEEFPEIPVLVTTTTPTGSGRVRAVFGGRVQHCYLPYDIPGAMKRFFQRVKPRCCVIMETELWPNLLKQCRTHNVPVMLANARLSEKSARGYARVSSMTHAMLQSISHVAVQSVDDGERFVRLGFDEKKLTVTGSVKFDIAIDEHIETQARNLREKIGLNRPVWVAASTHAGEEEQVLNAFEKVLSQQKEALLILVPRHPDRFGLVEKNLIKQNFTFVKRSESVACDAKTQVLLGDTMGEMFAYLGASDVVFVGGSFIAVGGHNVMEPAALAKPILIGPHWFNFAEAVKQLQQSDAIIEVDDSLSLAKNVLNLFEDVASRQSMGVRAKQVVDNNRGAVVRQFNILKKVLL
ncbi:MAG: lipid IV(A) 3-deoxy-D-manno-octulosonic acid transferase [Gammaproteobacteria bacterium]